MLKSATAGSGGPVTHPISAYGTSVDGASSIFLVRVPVGVQPGQEFQVHVADRNSRIVRVRCPPGASAGQFLRVSVPLRDPTTNNGPQQQQQQQQQPSAGGGGSQNQTQETHPQLPPRQTKDRSMQLFEMQVPVGVMPGQPLAVLVGGVRMLVTCPVNFNNAGAVRQLIRFQLPLALLTQTIKRPITPDATAVQLSLDKDGWTQVVRGFDLKLQWVRLDDKGYLDTTITRFHLEKSAYVRTLEFYSVSDNYIMRHRDEGFMSLVPANEACFDSSIEDLVTVADILIAQRKDLEGKTQWFHDFAVAWNEGGVMCINVRRDFLLEDSVKAVTTLSRRDLRKAWSFKFIGEAGIDAGGLAREWFQLVTEAIFDPLIGLWQPSEANQMCMIINPASSKVICDDYLKYYRFLGRVMGKALFDRQLVAGHMVPFIYKHMLGWPITFEDIQVLDEEYYNNLKDLQKLAMSGEDLSMLCLSFTTTVDNMGAKEEVELVEGGKDMVVDNDNYPEYLEACLKFRMMEAVRAQLTELLLGFYDVIPEPILTVFDFQELELLMCGLPTIDLEDWKEHTQYSGYYEFVGADCPTCQWFWEVVEEFDHEMKARLLQFVTGTSGVPSRGFGVLQGKEGNIRRFTIHGVSVNTCLYPRAHTCFNLIDLPAYKKKEDLRDRLKLAVTMAATGFHIV